MLIDIVVLPPPLVAQNLAHQVKRASRGRRAVFVVDAKKLKHHLSLFHVNVINAKFPLVESIVQGLAHSTPHILLKPYKIHFDADSVWLEYCRSTPLVKLKNLIIKRVAPLRLAPMPYASSKPLPKLRRIYRKRFGVHYNIGPFFRPHLTLAKYRNVTDARAVALQLNVNSLKFHTDTLALAQINRRHQVTKILKKFKV